jgi:hypothetical protein
VADNEKRKITLHFHPYKFENKLHAVEKQEGGQKRRYLKGISSGIKTDGHQENLTMNCIQEFQRQAATGDILLYEGQHGVNFVDDIGKLVHSEITPEGDWLTEYRLYDSLDNMGPNTLEKADKLWRQINGLPPYKTPKQKGFSIEGEIPDGGILTISETGKRVMDNVVLDGVVVVPRPAYQDSVAQAVYKAMGLDTPQKIRKNLTRNLQDAIDCEEKQEIYFKRRWQIDEALNEEIEKIMIEGLNPNEKLDLLFDEYKSLMIELVISSADYFRDHGLSKSSTVLKASGDIQNLYEKLNAQLNILKGVNA